MKVHIFSVVWGKHCEWWRDCASRALVWPRNAAALAECDVLIDAFVEEPFVKTVWDFAAKHGFRTRISLIKPGGPQMQNACLRGALEHAVNEGAVMILMPGDVIFGDGTIPSLLRIIGHGKNRAVAAAHARVAPGAFLKAWTGEPMGNAELVRAAMATLHPDMASCKLPEGKNAAWHFGVGWGELGENLFSVTNHLPTIHAIDPMREDVTHYESAKPGEWDHEFPSTLLAADRYRLVGSSDAAFAAELSPKPKSGRHFDEHPVDSYKTAKPHNLVNKSAMCIWRAAA